MTTAAYPDASPARRLRAPGPRALVRAGASLLRGHREDARWVRPALIGLLAVTAVLYLWNLGASGWGNAFYAAAVQAGATSWKAFFFGSFDSANFITVDKPPASLWVMEISARIVGVNAWSILVPQALEGVAAVGLLYATVRRWFGPAAGLLAGAVMALTPVAALMFRFDNPDALLTLLLVAAFWAAVRSLDSGRLRWLLAAMGFVGLAFDTKMMQAFLVVPAMVLVYLLAAPHPLLRRLWHLAAAAVALLVSAGWWVAAVTLTPAADRPYIGGSQDNSVLNLIFGYNGFGRLTGNEAGSVGGTAGPTGASMWGPTGWNRLFFDSFGGQVSWLIPAAILLLVAGLVFTARAPRRDRTRAALLLWGGWLLVTGATISFAGGIIHPYYTVALAPAIGALVGMGTVLLWNRRSMLPARLLMAGALAVTGWWSFKLLERTPDWHPWLRWVVVAAAVLAAVLVLVPRLPRASTLLAAGAATVAALAGPTAYTLTTVSSSETGAIPSAGPALAGNLGGPGGGAGGGPGGLRGLPAGAPPGGPGAFAGAGGFPPPGAPGGPPALPGAGGGPSQAGVRPGAGGAAGGLLTSSSPSAALVALLQKDASGYTWIAAAVGANSAAGYQLSTGDPVMALGGFNGTDPTPTLAEFQALVGAHKVHYFLGGMGGFGGPGGGGTGSTSSQISTWVTSTFSSTTVGGVTVYDLTSPLAG